MTQQRLFLFQTLLEALIPILGYFEWGWDISFIFLFYLIDWLLALGINIAKGRRRILYSRLVAEKQLLLKSTVIVSALLIATAVLVICTLAQLNPGFNWASRTWEFLAYEDMGIAQGIVLVPLMVFNGVLVYKQQFLLTARYRTMTMQLITQPLVVQGYILLACSGILLGISQFTRFPEIVLVLISIAGISGYRWLILRNNN